MRAVRGRANRTTEQRLRYALVQGALSGWELHPKDVPGSPDFYFRKRQFAVFVDGCFWHGCRRCGHIPRTNRAFWKTKIERNRRRDRAITRRLRARGIRVLRLWEHQISRELRECVRLVRDAARATPRAHR